MIALRPRLLAASALAATLAVPATAPAAGPAVSTAPGRVVLPVDGGALARNVDAGGASAAVALPGGATLLFGTGSTQSNVLRIVKLGPDGAIDRSFGSDGVATYAAPGRLSYGFGVVRQADGKLLLIGVKPPAPPLASGGLLLVQDDGSVVIAGEPQRPAATTPAMAISQGLSKHYLLRYTAAGAPDAAFGIAGAVDLEKQIEPSQLLASAGGAVLVVGAPAYGLIPNTGPKPGRLNARLVAPNGSIVQTRTVDLAFGGGGSSFIGNVRPRPVGSIKQNTFSGRGVVRRSDGSYLAAGGVHVSRPTGEGTGFSIGRFAAAALTPGFARDPSFGGPATTPKLTLKVARQRARSAYTRHGIRVELTSSAVGLARVSVSTRGGRVIARGLLPVFKTTRHTLLAGLTKYGNTYLRRHRDVRVSVSATGRDLLASSTTATARGRLK